MVKATLRADCRMSFMVYFEFPRSKENHRRHDEVYHKSPSGVGVFDRLVEFCPLRLTSPSAPTSRETIGAAIVGMLNGSSRYQHFDALAGDAVTFARAAGVGLPEREARTPQGAQGAEPRRSDCAGSRPAIRFAGTSRRSRRRRVQRP